MSSNLHRSWSSRFLGKVECGQISGRLLLLSSLLIGLIASGVSASPRVAVVAGSARWCELLVANGYQCDNLPETGPDGPLEAYDVVISGGWTDPDGLLADFMRAGGGVITYSLAPLYLGIDTDPTVRAWIGANEMYGGDMECVTVTTDPILGDLPLGTELLNCGLYICRALADTSGHPNAKILAVFPSFGTIGVLRNSWEGGKSVYLAEHISPGQAPWHDEIILNAVRILAAPPIPAVSDWSLAIMTLLILSAGSIVLLRRGPPRLKRV